LRPSRASRMGSLWWKDLFLIGGFGSVDTAAW
jgi:hypothetical protein